VTRRAIAWVLAVIVVAGIGTAIVLLSRSRVEPPTQPPPAPPGLALLVVKDDPAPFVAVIGSSRSTGSAAVTIPAPLPITIPGQGDGTVAEAVTEPGPTGSVAVSNLLGMWVQHRAITTMDRFLGMVRRIGGIELAGRTLLGRDVRASLDVSPGAARDLAWRTLLEALLQRRVTWTSADLVDTDDLGAVDAVFANAVGDHVRALPTEATAGGITEPDLEAVGTMTRVDFGAPVRHVIPVALLNGSGVPGIGQRAAELIVPGGFRVVVSENASSFGHATTAIVVAFHRQVQLADRVRDLLGVGRVVVAGPPSGLADVTIVIGKDLGAE
jgi:LytR cell envelope-related transcriptional attenuator